MMVRKKLTKLNLNLYMLLLSQDAAKYYIRKQVVSTSYLLINVSCFMAVLVLYTTICNTDIVGPTVQNTNERAFFQILPIYNLCSVNNEYMYTWLHLW